MPDADIEDAVNQVIGAAFGSSGERCMAISVAVCVGEETADEFVKRCAAKMATLKTGAFSENSNDFGPLISEQHLETVKNHVKTG